MNLDWVTTLTSHQSGVLHSLMFCQFLANFLQLKRVPLPSPNPPVEGNLEKLQNNIGCRLKIERKKSCLRILFGLERVLEWNHTNSFIKAEIIPIEILKFCQPIKWETPFKSILRIFYAGVKSFLCQKQRPLLGASPRFLARRCPGCTHSPKVGMEVNMHFCNSSNKKLNKSAFGT